MLGEFDSGKRSVLLMMFGVSLVDCRPCCSCSIFEYALLQCEGWGGGSFSCWKYFSEFGRVLETDSTCTHTLYISMAPFLSPRKAKTGGLSLGKDKAANKNKWQWWQWNYCFLEIQHSSLTYNNNKNGTFITITYFTYVNFPPWRHLSFPKAFVLPEGNFIYKLSCTYDNYICDCSLLTNRKF